MMNDERSLGQNCQICDDRDSCRKAFKFIEMAQIREFCEFCNAHEKFTALVIVYWRPMPPKLLMHIKSYLLCMKHRGYPLVFPLAATAEAQRYCIFWLAVHPCVHAWSRLFAWYTKRWDPAKSAVTVRPIASDGQITNQENSLELLGKLL